MAFKYLFGLMSLVENLAKLHMLNKTFGLTEFEITKSKEG